MAYRADIDGLRAVAILSVLLFHAFPAMFPGGFVGVDVFFVISGYLISKIIIEASERGRFSYLEFYDRRVRRILPAFLVVSAAVLVAAFFTIFPIELRDLAASFLASLFFVGNVFFYETYGYFAQSAARPLFLHYWSLGVEEQFYLLFPLAVALAHRLGPRALPAFAITLFVVSLIVSEYQVQHAPQAAFYLLPSRTWELMTGTLTFLAIRIFGTGKIYASIATWSGGLLIACSLAFLSPSSPFPGLHALPACLGTGLIIYFGAISHTVPHAILGSALPRTLGKISFSLYLVHWPVMLLAARHWPYADPWVRSVAAISASIAIAAFLYVAVETPFRRGGAARRHISVLRLAACVIAISAAAVSVVYVADGFPQRLDRLAARYSAYAKYQNLAQFRSFECFMNEGQSYEELNWDCIPGGTEKVAIIWGDSGIAQYAQALDRRFRQAGYAMGQLTFSACPPFIGYDAPQRRQCRDFNDRSLASIIRRRPALVVLSWADWDDFEASRYLNSTLDRLTAAGLNVVVLGSGPRFNEVIPTVLARRATENNSDILAHKELNLPLIHRIDERLKTIVQQHKPVTFVPIFDAICPNEECPLLYDDVPVHFDSFHVTAEGAQLHVDRFFEKLVAPPA
jgi:peptidoglycan/LPS O-acetylase OafA/YrhL